jgi:DNA-binding transcriptional regulator GbsR (MarR family)
MTSSHPFLLEFARFAGEVAESLSFSRSIGQIYGLLYMSEAPLSLDDIARDLEMSKGNASINLRTLESWDAVRPVHVTGNRRDYYEADKDIQEVALRRIQEGVQKRLETLDVRLTGFLKQRDGMGDSPSAKVLKERLKKLQSLGVRIRKIVRFSDQIKRFL